MVTGDDQAYYYIKAVGCDAAGKLFDLHNWSIGSLPYRQRPQVIDLYNMHI